MVERLEVYSITGEVGSAQKERQGKHWRRGWRRTTGGAEGHERRGLGSTGERLEGHWSRD
jgi:hypothetical protein